MKRIAAALMLGAGLMLAGSVLDGATWAALPFATKRLAWNGPMKPFHVIDNIYYVGTSGVAVFLIVTPKGDILTDGDLPEAAPQIEQNIAALGFKLSDVKILLNSHAHFDHAGGLAELKKKTGARLYASGPDTPILESGHIDFGPSSEVDFPPVKVDHVVKDGETVSLGGTTLTAHITPGHTPGCTSWTTSVSDGGVRRSVLFFCSITPGGNPLVNNKAHPQIVAEYRQTLAWLKNTATDVLLAPHGDQFDLAAKLARVKPGAPNPFVDPTEIGRYAARMQRGFDAELARQEKAAGEPKP